MRQQAVHHEAVVDEAHVDHLAGRIAEPGALLHHRQQGGEVVRANVGGQLDAGLLADRGGDGEHLHRAERRLAADPVACWRRGRRLVARADGGLRLPGDVLGPGLAGLVGGVVERDQRHVVAFARGKLEGIGPAVGLHDHVGGQTDVGRLDDDVRGLAAVHPAAARLRRPAVIGEERRRGDGFPGLQRDVADMQRGAHDDRLTLPVLEIDDTVGTQAGSGRLAAPAPRLPDAFALLPGDRLLRRQHRHPRRRLARDLQHRDLVRRQAARIAVPHRRQRESRERRTPGVGRLERRDVLGERSR